MILVGIFLFINIRITTPSTQKSSFLYRNGRRKIGGIRENKKKNSNRENLSHSWEIYRRFPWMMKRKVERKRKKKRRKKSLSNLSRDSLPIPLLSP